MANSNPLIFSEGVGEKINVAREYLKGLVTSGALFLSISILIFVFNIRPDKEFLPLLTITIALVILVYFMLELAMGFSYLSKTKGDRV